MFILSIPERRYRGNGGDKVVKGISEDEAKEYIKSLPISDERPYIGATYRKDKQELWIHPHLDEDGFEYRGKTTQRKNSVFPKCIFLFRIM
tara:strand:- start:1865 stop:2137 length:273 start_codon:yes stop_codon:yes gene_type:complete